MRQMFLCFVELHYVVLSKRKITNNRFEKMNGFASCEKLKLSMIYTRVLAT